MHFINATDKAAEVQKSLDRGNLDNEHTLGPAM